MVYFSGKPPDKGGGDITTYIFTIHAKCEGVHTQKTCYISAFTKFNGETYPPKSITKNMNTLNLRGGDTPSKLVTYINSRGDEHN